MGNYIQYLIVNYNGKELKKEYRDNIYVFQQYACIHTYSYIYMNHFVVHMNLTQYFKSTIL